jgi:hypothetical protein
MRGFAAPELGMLLVVLIWGANFSVVNPAARLHRAALRHRDVAAAPPPDSP